MVRAPTARSGTLTSLPSRSDIAPLVTNVEERRQAVSGALEQRHRSRLGQFFTPAPIAGALAQLLRPPARKHLDILDPGAGVGSLATAVVARLLDDPSVSSLRIVSYEIDPTLGPHLAATGDALACAAADRGVAFDWDQREDDYIDTVGGGLAGRLGSTFENFDVVVMNPPYRKVATNSRERLIMNSAGVPVVNLYAAFLALAATQLRPGGQLAAITPRSFANGPYYRAFRTFFFDRMALDAVHVYASRAAAFADADVLQENIIFAATRDGERDLVRLSTSSGPDAPVTERHVPHEVVIDLRDPNRFLHLPTEDHDAAVATVIAALPATLADLGITVSTGRVVDFRCRDALRDEPAEDTVPLVYPGHLADGGVEWPKPEGRKPNALVRSDATEAMLLPNEPFVLVKRFSAKEERRRVTAATSLPSMYAASHVAFENHLNVFHRSQRGLSPGVAAGLAAFLNSTTVDRYIRQFNGHTQINATDLRSLRYPSLEQLDNLGRLVSQARAATQEEIDRAVETAIPPMRGEAEALAA
jgi:adenine-specific DNA-methyltransferase